MKNLFLSILRDIKKDMENGEQPGDAATTAILQTMQESVKGQVQEPVSMDAALQMLTGQLGQFIPMDEETAGQFQQLARKMIEQAGKET